MVYGMVGDIMLVRIGYIILVIALLVIYLVIELVMGWQTIL